MARKGLGMRRTGGLQRRGFLATGAAVAGAGLDGAPLPALAQAERSPAEAGYGPLVADPNGVIDLPKGFHYRVLLRQGDPLSNGTPRPGGADGMGAFRGPGNTTLLCLNHEVGYSGAFPVPKVAGDYDPPALGGTSVVLVGANRQVRQSWISSSGTVRNCAGGETPWGTWISCEENEDLPIAPGTPGGSPATKPHGWAFEVDPAAPLNGGQPRQVRLDKLGRFYHEASVIDPLTHAVYQTEDTADGLFYRFLPARGTFPRGFGAYATAPGTLEALSVPGLANANQAQVGVDYRPTWLTVPDPDGQPVRTRLQTYDGTPTRFFRGEGAWWSLLDDAVIFDTTGGGASGHFGQVWRYQPRHNTLRLLYQSTDQNVLDMPDNLAVLPWGEVVLCEDGSGTDYLRILTRSGQIFDLARNTLSEFAGACFVQPDTLYVNIQGPSITLAIWGPWLTGRYLAGLAGLPGLDSLPGLAGLPGLR